MPPRLISLLHAASQGRRDLSLATFDEAQIRWAIKTGLGPLLFQTTKADPEAATSPLWPLLKSADLTARILTGDQLDAMAEIIEACKGCVPPLTLLKGISICRQYYPEPHLRPMRDIDFLVDEADLPVIESLLFELGYGRHSTKPPEFYKKHHHSMPFFHPKRGVWVEVHRGLFPPKSKVSTDKVFSPENLKTQLRPSEFQGKKVNRLSEELQIAYIASHWAQTFNVIGGMVAMLDTIYLLKNTKVKINWERILGWAHGSVASIYIYLLLGYLAKYQVISIAPEIFRELSLGQRYFAAINVKILHSIIDDYLVNGRALKHIFSVRNLDIMWKTCLLPEAPIWSPILVPVNILLPFRLRKLFLT